MARLSALTRETSFGDTSVGDTPRKDRHAKILGRKPATYGYSLRKAL